MPLAARRPMVYPMPNRTVTTIWRVALVVALLLIPSRGHAATVVRRQPNVSTYADMRAQLAADARRCPWIEVCTLGKSASGTRNVLLVRYAPLPSARTLRLLVLCRQHGDEPASTQAMLGLLHGLAFGDIAQRRA